MHEKPCLVCYINIKLVLRHLLFVHILQFRDGGLADSPELGSYCGITLPAMFISSTNQLRIEFKSDWSARGQGFLFNWTATSDMPITTMPPTVGTTPGTVLQASIRIRKKSDTRKVAVVIILKFEQFGFSIHLCITNMSRDMTKKTK